MEDLLAAFPRRLEYASAYNNHGWDTDLFTFKEIAWSSDLVSDPNGSSSQSFSPSALSVQWHGDVDIANAHASDETTTTDSEYYEYTLSRQPSPLSAFEPQIMQDFVSGFLPADAALHSGAWLPTAMHLAHHGTDTDAATYSLRALAMVRVGYRWADFRMVMAGQEAYGLALRSLHALLNAPSVGSVDVAVASCRFLSCYEMFVKNGNATEPDPAWMIHQAGIEELLKVNGAATVKKGALLRGNADLMMRRAIAQRRAPPVSKSKVKSSEFAVWDVGCRFAGILQDLDVFEASSEGSEKVQALGRLMMKLVRLDQQLQSWYFGMSLARKAAIREYISEGYEMHTFTSLESAQQVVSHWALQILISHTINSTVENNPAIISSSSASHGDDLEQLLKQYSLTQRSEVALNILRSSWYFADGSYRATGYIHYSFAHNHAIEALLEHPAAIASNPWLKKLPLTVFSERGLPIHGTPPPVAPRLETLCVMSPFVKAYYGWPLTREHEHGRLEALWSTGLKYNHSLLCQNRSDLQRCHWCGAKEYSKSCVT